jgi:hypothetical protein
VNLIFGSLRAASYSVSPGRYQTSKDLDRFDSGRISRHRAHIMCRSMRDHCFSIACSGLGVASVYISACRFISIAD